jgi:predicted RNase H-like HicB family nuclease
LGDNIVKRTFNVVIEKDATGYFVGVVPELPGCHSQARSLDELNRRMKEAIELYLAVQKPASVKLNFVGIQQIEVSY